MERYRIGDFARELGVTPDFLKYCERKGIITPQVEENGYRYYGFTQSAFVLEYMKFKNLGYTAEEIREVIKESSFAHAIATMQKKAEEIRETMCFEQAVLAYCENAAQIAGYFGEEPVWQVRFCEDFYFLPHSVEDRFIGDAAIRERVRAWNPYFPIVHSVYRIECEEGRFAGLREKNVWGFGVNAKQAQALALDISAPVELVRPGRCIEVFSVQCMDREKRRIGGYARTSVDVVQDVAQRNNLTLCGNAYSKILFKIDEGGVRKAYSVLIAPVK